MSEIYKYKEIREELDKENVIKIDVLNSLSTLYQNKVLLIGDFILDIYTFCEAIGKTSKTPTLSVKKNNSDYFWGGAGLFAKNLSGLGASVEFITISGEDWGEKYISESEIEKINLHLFADPDRPTTLKERFWVDGYKLLQVDTVNNQYITKNIQKKIQDKISQLIDKCDIVLVSDPRHGLLSPELIQIIKILCKENSKKLIVDTQVSSRSGNVEEYIGVDMICVNETEARYFLRDERSTVNEILDKLYEETRVDRLILKLGMNGLIGYDSGKKFFRMPAIPVKAVDPIGSGDAFLSVAALTYNNNIKLMTSMFLATCAASLSVTKMGTVPTTYDELYEFVVEKADEIF